jgi:hypothetical protein
MRPTRLLTPLLLLLAACGRQQADGSVVTADEDRQLNEAAASLEANLAGAGETQEDFE